MCALRNNRTTNPSNLACQYRLSITPRKHDVKRVIRRGSQQVVPTVALPEQTQAPNTCTVDEKEQLEHSNWPEFDGLPDDFNFDDDDFDYHTHTDADNCQHLYEYACRQLRRRPLKVLQKCLTQEEALCKTICLHSKDVRAFCIAMVYNRDTKRLDFEHNTLSAEGGRYFADVIASSHVLTDVRLAENQLRGGGAKDICAAVVKNPLVVKLDLSGNEFCENDAQYFQELLEETSTLKELYLAHNNFREEGAVILAQALANNDTLRVLDLRWNHIRMAGATAIGQALTMNSTLEVLNLSWNGLYLQGSTAIAHGLAGNRTLQELDITCNRLSEFCLAEILKGLQKNTTLKVLKFGNNHLSHKGALSVLQSIKKMTTSGIEVLDFGEQNVQDNFEELVQELREIRDIKVLYGTVWRADRKSLYGDDDDDELALLNENPVVVLMECMRLQRFRLIDMFNILDKDKSKDISVEEFTDGLMNFNIPLSRKAVLALVKKLDTDHDNFVDYVEMIEAQKEHKLMLRQMMQDNVTMETTDVGRVSALLKKIMDVKCLNGNPRQGTAASRNSQQGTPTSHNP